ncbi:hypothetical protein AXL3_47 [Stenotrophomonas phage vB_SmaS-AXL_3]|uniref:Uncharacterized protein n=1 Tax=Stenotrophomonas phage vB_SmaS-AXL_3 TaxID=2740427 RepID=A0A7D4XPJ1_9CAUD|nr:hypothetical protein PQE62_gp47 [Stenotrophomonas phage vB_SmaS-AXL_3]QKW95596.1 hypothetical protein AXL3_47 [Stenotrophomonas phage vB_SmaS-AXL_3]
MIHHTQLFRHEADKRQWGDCHRTALASILNLPSPEDAPHFIGMHEEAKADGKEFEWMPAQEEWLNSLGYTSVDIFYNGDLPVETLFEVMKQRNPNVLYLLGGTSPRGTNHTVVAHGSQGFYHDPHPDGGFLVAPMDHGLWEVTFILPLIMKEVRP